MQDFRRLQVWQRAHQLALLTYRITKDFPRDEVFGLRQMMRKTSIDIPAFIAEGCGKPNDPEFARSLSGAISLGNRLEQYSLMAKDLQFLDEDIHRDYENEIIEVKKMIAGFIRRLTGAAAGQY